MNRIVVFSSIPKLSHHIRMLMPQLEIIEIIPGNDEVSKQLEMAEIIIADVGLIPKYINNLKSIKWIQATSAGVDKLFAQNKTDKNKYSNFIISRFINNDYGMDLAEYVIAHIVNHERNQWHEYNCQRKKIWAHELPDRRLIGDMTIGILGFGNLGQCVGKMLKNFGAKIWGLTRTQSSPEALKILDEHRTTNNLPDLLKNCDYIISLMPATPETDGLLNGNMLEHCREKETVFMSLGRGNIIKEIDLVNALEKKWISAAILDVFEVEPLPETSQLWHIPQVIVTPHNACTAKAKTIASLFQSNYDKFINNKLVPNIVDYQRGY